MKAYTTLEVLILSFNPFIGDCKDTYIYQILSKFWEIKTLNRINKHPISADMRDKTINWQKTIWKAKVEKDREEREKKEREEKEKEEKEKEGK